ncbi:PLP-dependent aminotransferase family protein [Litorilituus lipolyticus]|uniref:PLP-dependent aminotransferase family protein n=1 Tax=Litorilituus lipolyticus TaxID=2491017 RepID=A0A502L6S8_9GAMM|nr:PLP-dependent aminotransferase family protein [Litorilituus lipolyticus]TPH18021.1 PLP-dependent aminotransferase family protein [Litorilituus lipolyticus]
MKALNLSLANEKKAKYLIIADAIRAAIKTEQVAQGELLPSARTLAQQLNVNRHTVMAAFAELVAQGWVESRERASYRVVKFLPIQTSKSLEVNLESTAVLKPFKWQFAKQVCSDTHLASANKKASEYLFNFSGGQPDIRQFPFDEFKSYFAQVCQRPNMQQLSYGDNQGEQALIEQISIYLRRVRSITEKKVMICNGSQEALYMISQLLLQTGDYVAVEQLGYPPAWAAFKSAGAKLLAIKQDEKGVVPEHLAKELAKGKIKLIYLTPLHQYPTTVTLDIQRRRQIYQLASQYGVAIVEDDYDHEFHYDSQPAAPLAAEDPQGLVIYISTFSKLMFGGARVGYVAATDELIAQLAQYKMLINHKSNVLIQHAVAKWMEQGGFEAHLRRMTRLYHKRRDHMVALLKSYQRQGLSIEFAIPAGGMAIWLNVGKSVKGLKEKLLAQGVYIQTEEEFNINKQLPSNAYQHIRLGFAAMTEDEVQEGVATVMGELFGSPK